jgi:hypothetical protein
MVAEDFAFYGRRLHWEIRDRWKRRRSVVEA